MRLFLAVSPDRPAEGHLAARALQVQAAIGDLASALRWPPAANIHATLHFLGEIDRGRLPRLREVLAEPLTEPAFLVALGDIGVFPPAGAPRVIWLDVAEGRDALARVHETLGQRLAAAGVAIESRPFSPHLTIARVPDRERSKVKALRERLATVPPMRIEWMARSVTLFRSDLSGAVPRYEALQEIALASDVT